MAAIYTQKWTSHITSQTAQALIENEWNIGTVGLTAEQIQHGIDRAREECDWPPSISEFINLCLDIPTLSDFMNGDEAMTKAALFVSGKSIFDLKRMSVKEMERWKKDAYREAVKLLRSQRMNIEPAKDGHP
jgi:hypothetical protein